MWRHGLKDSCVYIYIDIDRLENQLVKTRYLLYDLTTN